MTATDAPHPHLPEPPEPPDAPDAPPAHDDVRVGAWSVLGSPLAASILAGTGADWLVLDAQHGLYDEATTLATLAALSGPRPGRTSRVLVRVAAGDPAPIGRALDAGASGVVVPLVQDEHEAAAAARACRFPPDGGRSWGGWAGVWDRGPTTPADANRAVTCAVMVETPSALERVEAIAATPGVDMVFLGPYDLSIALGVSHADLLADRSPDGPLARVVRACRGAGVAAGAYAGGLDAARVLRAHGFTWLAVLSDATLLTESGAGLVTSARDLG